MSLFVNPKRKVRYVPVSERELAPERQTAFILKTLSHREWEERQDYSRILYETERQARVNGGAWIRWTLVFGLVGVEGAPTPLPFGEGPRVTDEFLDSLMPSLRLELANEVERISKLAYDDPKD